MATRAELQNPEYVPYEMELRYLLRDNKTPRLQQYQSRHGWRDVTSIREAEIPTGNATPNARNA